MESTGDRGRNGSTKTSLWSLIVQAAAMLDRWQTVYAQRRQLLSLDERILKDIGVSRADAEREGSRPFWDLPQQGEQDSGHEAEPPGQHNVCRFSPVTDGHSL